MGWVGARLDRKLAWKQVASVIEGGAYQTCAAKRKAE